MFTGVVVYKPQVATGLVPVAIGNLVAVLGRDSQHGHAAGRAHSLVAILAFKVILHMQPTGAYSLVAIFAFKVILHMQLTDAYSLIAMFAFKVVLYMQTTGALHA